MTAVPGAAASLATLPDPLPVDPVTGPIDVVATVPGSKSITNRALVCAALARGRSTLEGALVADDTEAMVGVLRSLGLTVSVDQNAAPGADNARIVVGGCAGAVPPATAPLDVRQSGTTARFTLPLVALGSGPYVVDAHPQMRARPMHESIAALRSLGAAISDDAAPGHLPAIITPRPGPTASAVPTTVTMAGDVSSQFLSGLLLVGPCLPGGLRVELATALVSRPYVDMTVAVMAAFGAVVHQPDPSTFLVAPTGYVATTYQVEPDASAASYPLAAAAICGGRATVPGLGAGSLQGDARFAAVLGAIGGTVEQTGDRTTVAFEPGAPLRGGTFDFADISDTAQTAAVLAPFADAPVRIGGIGFIRRKEIDRVAAVATELGRLGVRVDVDDDGWTIHPGPVRGGVVQTSDDHRMAMSFALLGLRVPGIAIATPACVAKTFPGYWGLLDQVRRGEHGR
jgi:3-phosphoshikimate 1-carboxyvinyltransferase